jgi:SAM-dependent methyltransferase
MLDDPPFDAGLNVRFPASGFISQAEFFADAERDAVRLARQARVEAALATAEPLLSESATCAPCLRPALLTSATLGGRPTDTGLPLPDWPAEQICDCEDRLAGRDRALLHAAESVAGLRPWSRLLLFGPPTPLHRRLRALAGDTLAVPDLSPGPALAAPDAAAEVVVAADCLHRLPVLRPVLAELRRVCAPGGCLLARVPFRERAPVSVHRRPLLAGPRLSPTELHAIGWDILAMLRDAGWAHAEVLRYWSRELGYLGANNFLLRAVA